jgi:glycogen operon protein
MLRAAEKAWHGVKLHQPDWGDDSHSVALGATLRKHGLRFHFILNAHWSPLEFELPDPGGADRWRRWIDTALESPDDIVPWEAAPPVSGPTYRAEARSVVMLYLLGPGSSGGRASEERQPRDLQTQPTERR